MVVFVCLILSVCKRYWEVVGGIWGKCFGSGISDGLIFIYFKKKYFF